MNKVLKVVFGIFVIVNFAILISLTKQEVKPSIDPIEEALRAKRFETTLQAHYTSLTGTVEPDEETQVPIPLKDRVYNRTGTQCVYCTIETLGRWNEERKLTEPPLTTRRECQSFSDPGPLRDVLNRYKVRFEQTYDSVERACAMMRKATAEGRGCGFGVPHHMMTCVHFDEKNDVIKWIDNVDKSLKIQTAKLSKFKHLLDGWAVVVYPDTDVIQDKVDRLMLPRLLRIVDRNNVQGTYPKDYIPLPKR